MLRESNKTICLKVQIIAHTDAVIDPNQGVAHMLGELLKMTGYGVREDCPTILIEDAKRTSAKEELSFRQCMQSVLIQFIQASGDKTHK